MKTNNKYNYILVFCYSVFTLCVTTLSATLTIYDWCLIFLFNGGIFLLVVLLLSDKKENLALTDLFSLVYVLFILARQIFLYNNYTKTYHRQIHSAGNILLTVLIILMLCNLDNIKQKKFTLPVFIMIVLMFVLIFILNKDKFNPVNLYKKYDYYNSSIYNITLFDYIIPLNLSVGKQEKSIRKNTVFFVIIDFFILIFIVLFSFGCIKGDLMYSISPLQSLFLISSGEFIKNFDAVFNFFLYFAYFAAIRINIQAYTNIKSRFTYTNKLDLLLLFPFVLLWGYVNNLYFLIIQALMVLILFIGRKKVRSGGQN